METNLLNKTLFKKKIKQSLLEYENKVIVGDITIFLFLKFHFLNSYMIILLKNPIKFGLCNLND